MMLAPFEGRARHGEPPHQVVSAFLLQSVELKCFRDVAFAAGAENWNPKTSSLSFLAFPVTRRARRT
jgi:hypothetical protein